MDLTIYSIYIYIYTHTFTDVKDTLEAAIFFNSILLK